MLSQDSGVVPALTRRRVLVDGGRGLLLLGLLGAAVTACGSDVPAEPDPLEQQLELARHDSDLATAAAKAAPPAAGPALTEVAAERSRHATALIEEIARAAGKPTPDVERVRLAGHHVGGRRTTAERRRRRRHAAQLRRERHQAGTDPVGVSGRSAGLDRSVLHHAVLGGAAVEGPARSDLADAATPDRTVRRGRQGGLFDAVATEHAAIYGYGIVSAHSSPDENDLVSAGAGPAPRATRGGDHDAVRALGQGSAARRRLPVAVPGHHPGRRRASWRFGWRTTARWPGAR